MEKIIVNNERYLSMEDFKVLAERAAYMGATHMNVSQVIKSIWQWNEDRYDPYPNWSTFRSSIFKIIVPDALREYLPTDYAKKNEELLVKRAEILGEFGLKASFVGFEPAYLPEKAYVDHPMWRGPRCDQTRRARREYFSPCIDNQEVLDMYKEAVFKLCKIAPIEYFTFLTNDSGGGICWSDHLYPGKNGPKSCKHIGFADRVVRFMSTLQEGAANAGIKAEVSLNNGMFSDAEKIAANAKVLKGQYINSGLMIGGHRTNVGIGNKIRQFSSTIYVPQIISAAEDLENITEDIKNVNIYSSNVYDYEMHELVKMGLENPPKNPKERYDQVFKVAEGFIGSEHAGDLVSVWDTLERGIESTRGLDNGGHIYWIATVHQRWITRPLVPFPGELTADEKNYYRDFQFQATTEEDADDLLNIQGHSFIEGYSGVFLAFRALERSIKHYNATLKKIRTLKGKINGNQYLDKLCELEYKVRMLLCLADNAINVCKFQDILDRADYSDLPAKDKTPVWYEQGDIHYVKIKEIFRDEIDNTLEMISILEESKKPVLVLARNREEEDIVQLGPDIVEQLKKKICIMQAHTNDFNRLFMSFNI